MGELSISQVIALSEKLKENQWIITLMQMDKKGQIQDFFKMIDMPELLQNINNQQTR